MPNVINANGDSVTVTCMPPEPELTLRDYFAARAMQGALASGRAPLNQEALRIAGRAYELADAMMIVRNYKPE